MEQESSASVDLLRQEIEILRSHMSELRRVFGGMSEEAAPRRETNYRGLVENAPVILYRVPMAEGEPAYFSPATEAITGVPAQQMDWRRYVEMMHPEDRLRVLADIERLGAANPRSALEYRLIRTDGSVAWLDDRARLEFDVDGKRVALEGVVLDVSDRKAREEQLHGEYDLLLRQVHRSAGENHLLGGSRALVMAYLHDSLARSPDAMHLHVAPYVDAVTASICDELAPTIERVLEVGPVVADFESTARLGRLVHEMVSRVLAQSEARRVTVRVAEEDGSFVVQVDGMRVVVARGSGG